MKTLVVYYSLQGHTKKVAEIISEKLGADIVRLKPKRDYNFATSLTVGRKHIKDKHMPELKSMDIDMDEYDTVFIGTPVWWYTFTPPIRTFINHYDVSDKKVSFFSTHQGANGNTFKDLKELTSKAYVKSAKDFFYSRSEWQHIEKDVESLVQS